MRQRQAEASREKLQQIVFRLSQDRTLDEIRIRDICDEAGMSVGNFYLYFPSKENALLYSYRTKDDAWATQGLEDIADPLARLCGILATHLYSMTEHSLCFDTQLYISQLKVYEDYYFTKDRFLHRATARAVEECRDAGLVNDRHSAYGTAMRLLNFSRGLVYSYCIGHREDHERWLQYAIGCQREYIELFLTEAGRARAAAEGDALWQPITK